LNPLEGQDSQAGTPPKHFEEESGEYELMLEDILVFENC